MKNTFKIKPETIKLVVMLSICALAFAQPVLAASTIPEQLTTAVDNIYSIFNSSIMKTILMIAFCGLIIGMVFNWDSQGAKKKFIIWIIAVVALMNVSAILEFFGWTS
jgi:hypothetical protein